MLYLINKHKCINNIKPIHTGRDSYYEELELDGTTESVFILNFIKMLDLCIIRDNYKYLSIEQEDVLKNYFNNAVNMPLSDYNKQLDNYLGSYIGEENGRYFTK